MMSRVLLVVAALLAATVCAERVHHSMLRRSEMASGLFAYSHPNGFGYVLTPSGWLLEHCVTIDLPSGAVLESQPDGSVHVLVDETLERVLPPCERPEHIPPRIELAVDWGHDETASVRVTSRARTAQQLPSDYDGWQTFASYNYGAPISAFLGTFSTPDIPKQVPAVDFIFTGLQNINWIPKVDPWPSKEFDIIQPVLQYPANGGNYWSVRSWIVSIAGLGGQTAASVEVPMQVGDWVFGNMTQVSSTSWDIISTNTRTNQTTKLTTRKNERLRSQPWAYVTLETYGANNCDYFPTLPSAFVGMSLAAQNGSAVIPKWTEFMAPAANLKCSTVNTQIQSPQKVQIRFR
eukprot:comp18719_c0_seq1/m.33985 comp18719_c0_seq1/g.33985  ORF comp18719_c0_seq1/g.33985 comp18719_c0_seq1/m.33985 type:complete len:349 (-) comp18719_c0_seq1:109-1155(-)